MRSREDSGESSTNRQSGIQVVGYLRAEMGTGQHARLLIDGIRAAGIPYSTFTVSDTIIRQQHPFSDTHANQNVNVLCINADELPHFARRTETAVFSGRYNIGFWAWELEEFPRVFNGAFEFVDEIWSVSEFVRQSIAASTDKPVFAFPPLIVTPEVSSRDVRQELELGERFFFLFCCDLLSIFERKNPLGLVEAFSNAFQAEEGPLLVIKTTNGDRRSRDLDQLQRATQGRADIRLIDGYWPGADLGALMNSCDCYVSLHRSEGFGLTMAEAMSLGRPVIATAYSGNLDFMNAGNSFLVDYEYGPVPEGCDPYPEGARWADPNLDHAKKLMRTVYESREVAQTVASRGEHDVRGSYSVAAASEFLLHRYSHAQQVLQSARVSRARCDEAEAYPENVRHECEQRQDPIDL